MARVFALAVLVGGAAGFLLSDIQLPVPLLTAEATRAGAATGDPIAGRASVIDGDTIEVHGTRIRLHGIDAPESDQLCMVRAVMVRCGQQAAVALADRIGPRPVTCEARDRDRYGRVVAVCSVGGEDLNAWLVASGLALAYREYSGDYVSQEAAASAAKIGLWQGEFVAPWNWRRGERLSAERRVAVGQAGEAGSCVIKGNISAKGERIYHVPGGAFYENTRISPGKGERWFCSEADARAAGWRRSLR